MAEITNNNERWNGHTYVEIENFVKSKLDQIPSTESIDSVVQGKLTTELSGYASIDSIASINERINGIEVNTHNIIAFITYAELKELSDSSHLIPGMQYQITDYEYTPNNEEYGLQVISGENQFDIIVTADSSNTINENARAIQHIGDTYFSESNLTAWELKYVLNTDPQLGKGTITWMKDEWGNECYYDFKNARFERGVRYYYTFSHIDDNVITDDSLNGISQNNKIGRNSYHNIFYENANNNTLGDYCQMNDFGRDCTHNTLRNKCRYNTFGNVCYLNTFGESCTRNTFGNECSWNTFGYLCYSNTFGNECYSNTFGNYCNGNTFGDYNNNNNFIYSCYSNTFGNNCCQNTFGNVCSRNTFRNYCSYNTFGNNCECNTFEDDCRFNTFRNKCQSNTFRFDCHDNTFGDECKYNTFGLSCDHNTFGDYCTHNLFGKNGEIKSFYRYITFEGHNNYIDLYCTESTGFNSPYKNVKIDCYLHGEEDNRLIIEDDNVNQAFSTLFTWDGRKLINYYVDPNSGGGYGYGPNLEEYVTETELYNTLQEYVKVTDIPDVSNLAIKDEIPSLEGLATESWVYDRLANIHTGGDYDYGLDLSEYVTETELYNTLQDYAEKSEISSLEGYATQEWVNSQLLNISSGNYDLDLSEYVNESELQAYALKTEIPSLEGYATEEWVNTQLSNLPSGNYDVDFSEFVTETELNVVKNLKEVTYNELVTLRNSNKLVPGMQYRITDYDCNLISGGDDGSARNQFDIIVTADSSNSINEKARAIQHAGDTYFSNSNLAAWELKYTLDTNLFYSTDKGTITYMKDEFNNECYYDFKNILVDDRFTFDYEYNDYSLNGNCHDNKLGRDSIRNIFMNQYNSTCAYNILGDNCTNNIFGSDCVGNVFGTGCYDNNFSDDCTYNVLNPHCKGNSFGTGCTGNTLGLNCNYIQFGNYYRYIIVENGNQNIYLHCNSATSENNYYQNVKIAQGYYDNDNLEEPKEIYDSHTNQKFLTIYENVLDTEMISGE